MQHILITGGNAGIGKETAVALARKGAKVIIACRDLEKAKQAVSEIKSITKSQEVRALHCDLANLDSVRTAIQNYKERFGRLDILINNAGLITDKLQFTKDGFEMQIGVNHLGHFLLTTELMDILHRSEEPRIINVSSHAHYKGKINFDSFRGEQGPKSYSAMQAYRQSKLANVLFTKELARRYSFCYSHSLHPGVVSTAIAEKNDNGILWRGMWKVFKPLFLSPTNGAKTTVYLASSPEALKTNGKYFCKQKEKAPAKLAEDEALAKKLWDVSTQLVSKYIS